MADNVTANSGDGLGPVFKTDDDGTAHWPYAKLAWGADNTQTPVASGVSAIPIQDGGNTITVDGTVAATQSGTWNVGTVTSITNVVQVGDNSTTLSVDDGAGSLTVDNTGTFAVQAAQSGTWNITNVSGTVSLPTGAATSANQTTIIGHVDGIEGLLTTMDADTSVLALLSKAEDAAHVSGDPGIMALAVRNDSDTALATTTGDYTPLQVDSSGYLKVNIKAGAGSGGTASTDDAAFTAASGSGTPIMGFATSDSVDSGDVGVLAMTTNRQLKVTLYQSNGTEATYINANVDSVAGATDAGIPVLAVRDDSLTTLTPADGDYVPLRVSSTGALHVTGGGGGTEYTEDAAAAADPVGNAQILVRQDTLSTTTVTADGDNIAARGASTGAQYVEVTAGTTKLGSSTDGLLVNLGANNDVTITSGTVSTTQSGTWTVQPGNTANTTAWLVTGTGGTFPVTDSGGTLSVDDGAGALTVDNAGTFAVQESGAALTALQVIDNPVVVDDAAFTPATTSVMMAGFTFDDVTPDTVNEGDAGAARMSANRNIYINIRDAAGNERGANVNASSQLSVSVDNDVCLTSVQSVAAATVAHDSAISGASRTAIIGLNARSTDPTAVASADATQALASLLGKQVTLPYAIPGASWSYASPSAVTDTADDVVLAAGAAGVRHYITGVQVFNGHDTVGTEVVIKDGTTVLWRGWAEQTGGGCSARFDPPLRGTAATAVNVANITTGSSTYFNVQGFSASE